MGQMIYETLRDTTWDSLPGAVQERAKLCLLDLIGVGLQGTRTELSQIITAHAADQFGGTIPMLFTPGRASAAGVALAGGMTIDAVDGHDGFNPAKGCLLYTSPSPRDA